MLPPFGQPWAPPGRCATLWLILAEALENEHDAAGAVLANERTENGSVRALRLRWRGRLRGGWAGEVPVLHLDATLRAELVRPYLPYLAVREPVAATMPHVRVRQVLGSPTTAKALTPAFRRPSAIGRPPRIICATCWPMSVCGPASCTGPDATRTCCSSARRPRSMRCVPPAFLPASMPCTSTA